MSHFVVQNLCAHAPSQTPPRHNRPATLLFNLSVPSVSPWFKPFVTTLQPTNDPLHQRNNPFLINIFVPFVPFVVQNLRAHATS